MILIIDNYDSFTYNIVQEMGELGAELSVYRNDEITVGQICQLQPERIVISPGPGFPGDAGISLDVIRELGAEFPILGVCLGHQSIGEAYGGKIIHAPLSPGRRHNRHPPDHVGVMAVDPQPEDVYGGSRPVAGYLYSRHKPGTSRVQPLVSCGRLVTNHRIVIGDRQHLNAPVPRPA